MIDTPTLLIGLGGIGGAVAYRVWKQVPEDARQEVGLHLFDTDRNPDSGLGKPEFAPLWDGSLITQTSPGMSVLECYGRNVASGNVTEWFPMNDTIGQLQMTDGAGQVRAVSRLAFYDTLARGDLVALESTIEQLLRVRPKHGDTPLRVLVINSVAGGTGSGIFLQVPMYIRQYLSQTRGISNVVIRNMSLLPDIFVGTGKLGGKKRQRDNVNFNGYAAIKELDALMVARLSDNTLEEKQFVFPLEMEYMPGNATTAVVEPGPSPYETIFLMDRLNCDGNGRSLRSVGDYIDQAVDTVYLQLLSPMSGRVNGGAVNDVRSIDHSQGRARYASVACGTLRYPYAGIIDYLAYRWAAHGVGEKWLRVDRLFQQERSSAEKQKRNDPSIELPQLRHRYYQIIDAGGDGSTPDPFLKKILHSTRIAHKDKAGNVTVESKVDKWLQAIDTRIDEELQRIGGVQMSCSLDTNALRMESKFVNETTRGLNMVRDLKNLSKSRKQAAVTAVLNDVLWNDGIEEPYVLVNSAARMKGAHRLNTWLMQPAENGEVDGVDGLHPVATRYFLCRALHRLEQDHEKIKESEEQLASQLKNLERKYDNPETPVVESLSDVALDKRSDLKWYNRKGKLKEFAELVEADINAMQQTVASHARHAIKVEALNGIRSALEGMVGDWERFFYSLDRSLLPMLNAEINRRGVEHEAENGNPMDLHVLGRRQDKEAFWDQVCKRFSLEDISPQVCARLYQAHYCIAVERCQDPDAARRRAETEGNPIIDMFENEVVAWCGDKLRAEFKDLDMNIVEALRREGEQQGHAGAEDDSWLHKRFGQLKAIVFPWLPMSSDALGNQQSFMNFWGLHGESLDALGGEQSSLCKDLLEGSGDNPVVHHEFSRREIKRFAAVHTVSIHDVLPFRTGTGAYWKAYRDERWNTLMTPGRGMTPHVDKRWDSPAYLREMDDGEQAAALSRLRLGTLYARALEQVMLDERDMKLRWTYWGDGIPRQLTMPDGTPCPPDLLGLFDGLAGNYHLAVRFCELAQSREADARQDRSVPFAEMSFISGAGDLLGMLLKQSEHRARLDEHGERIMENLAAALADEILACSLRFYGTHNPNQAIKHAEETIKAIGDSYKVGAGDRTDLAKHILQIVAGRPGVWQRRCADKQSPLVFMG